MPKAVVGAFNALSVAAEWINHWSGVLVSGGVLVAIFFGRGAAPALSRWRDGVVNAVWWPFGAGARAEALTREVLAELRPNGGLTLRDAVMRVEERQARFQARMAFVLHDASDNLATWETDADGLYTWVSPAYARICGRSFDELKGWGWVVAVHHDDIDDVRQDWRLAVEERRAFERHMRVVHYEGAVLRVLSKALPLVASGKLIGWSGCWETEKAT